MEEKKLHELMSNPLQLHNMGLAFWVNKSVADIGSVLTISLLSSYLIRVFGTVELGKEEKEELVRAMAEEMVEAVISGDSSARDTLQ